MKSRSCPHESAVLEATRSGIWSSELEDHRNGCLGCAELTLVASVLQADAAELAADEAPLPDPQAIWMRGRLASRRRDLRRATRAITWMQRAAVGVFIAVGAAFAPGLWSKFGAAFRGMELHAAVVDLPRAAGSPVLVVAASLLVIGALALWELTAIHES